MMDATSAAVTGVKLLNGISFHYISFYQLQLQLHLQAIRVQSITITITKLPITNYNYNCNCFQLLVKIDREFVAQFSSITPHGQWYIYCTKQSKHYSSVSTQ